jgi:hypothetical protein
VTEKKASLKGRKPPEGDKRQFLLSIDADVIKNIKLSALEDEPARRLSQGLKG